MEVRRKYIENDYSLLNLEEIELRLEEVRSRFRELIKIEQEVYEKEILDLCLLELLNSTEEEKKVRKEVMQMIIKERKRNHIFRCMTKYIEKGK